MGHTKNVEKLTEREKESLRLWLDRKTAKEIALALGVSHHAVEKRLKMARTKLDVGSSLEAARLLASVEGYERTVAQAPDLATPTSSPPIPKSPSPVRADKWRLGLMTAISAAAVAAILIGMQSAPTMDPKAVSSALERSLEAQMAEAHSLFDRMDADSSGALDEQEFTKPFGENTDKVMKSESTLVIVKKGETRGRVVDPETIEIRPEGGSFVERRRAMFQLIDRDKDSEIDRDEFIQGQLEGIGPRVFSIELAKDDGE